MKKIFISASWPYLHTMPGIHNLMPILAADSCSVFNRLIGNKVLFICGTDEFGSRAERMAFKQQLSPIDLMDRNYALLRQYLLHWLEIGFDNFSRTTDNNHREFVQAFYKKIYDRKYVVKKHVLYTYCENCKNFLPDRFILGTCYFCNTENISLNACPNCKQPKGFHKLKNRKCRLCGGTVTNRSSKGWFFKLEMFTDRLDDYLKKQDSTWSNLVKSEISKNLHNNRMFMISRKSKWGISSQFNSNDHDTIYCWAESLLANMSSAFTSVDQRQFMKNASEKIYFMGKDNIPFYSILLPALLFAYGDKSFLPSKIVAHNFLKFKGQPCSKSNGNGIWIDEAKEILDNADCWRYYLLKRLPFKNDVDFQWDDFVSIINRDLVLTLDTFFELVFFNITHITGGKYRFYFNPNDLKNDLIREIISNLNGVTKYMNTYDIPNAIKVVFDYIDKLKVSIQNDIRSNSINARINDYIVVCKYLVLYLSPFLPNTARLIWKKIGFADQRLNFDFESLKCCDDVIIEGCVDITQPKLFLLLYVDELIQKYNMLQRNDSHLLEPIGEYCEKWDEF